MLQQRPVADWLQNGFKASSDHTTMGLQLYRRPVCALNPHFATSIHKVHINNSSFYCLIINLGRAFVVHCLDSIISLGSIAEISKL